MAEKIKTITYSYVQRNPATLFLLAGLAVILLIFGLNAINGHMPMDVIHQIAKK